MANGNPAERRRSEERTERQAFIPPAQTMTPGDVRRDEAAKAYRKANRLNPGDNPGVAPAGAAGRSSQGGGVREEGAQEDFYGRLGEQFRDQEHRQQIADTSAFEDVTAFTGGPGTIDTTVGTADPTAGGAGLDPERFDVEAPQMVGAQVADIGALDASIIDPAAAAGLEGFVAQGYAPSAATALLGRAADTGQRALLAQTANVRGGAAMQAAAQMGAQAEAARMSGQAAADLGALSAQEIAQRRAEELQAREGIAGLAVEQADLDHAAAAATYGFAGEAALDEAEYAQESGIVNVDSHHRTNDRLLEGLIAQGTLSMTEMELRQNAETLRQNAAEKGEAWRVAYEQYEQAVRDGNWDKALDVLKLIIPTTSATIPGA